MTVSRVIKRVLPLSVIVIGLPFATAQAQQGNEQLAKQLGVDAADYTTGELTQMKCIMDGDHSAAEQARLLAGVKGFGTVPQEAADASEEQLAQTLGVDASEYTIDQLVLLKSMMEDDQCSVSDPMEFVKSGEKLTPESASAKVQLAATLGVNPTAYTLAELVKMKFDD